jgi:hypothetical protein
VPAIAWLTQNVLFLLLGIVGLFGVALVFWWSVSGKSAPAAPASQEALE